MKTSIEKIREDLEKLIAKGTELDHALNESCNPGCLKGKKSDEEYATFLEILPDFDSEYQSWYSESMRLVRTILPERVSDFENYYKKPENRKNIDFENYRIEDCLQGLVVTRGYPPKTLASRDSATPHFTQQLAIIKGLKNILNSTLYDIKTCLQAEIFDDELDSAEYLMKKKFLRAAGAVAGVVLERHLRQVCENHQVRLNSRKQHPTICDFNDALKDASIIDIADWRKIQHLADLRNKCDHPQKTEPTEENISDLIEGVKKFAKALL